MTYEELIKKEAMANFDLKVKNYKTEISDNFINQGYNISQAIIDNDLSYLDALAQVLISINRDGADLLTCALQKYIK